MLSGDELIQLYRDHRDQWVLSVYLDASQTDPALRSAWHVRFQEGVRDARRGLPADADLDAFNAAVARLTRALGQPGTFLAGRGWVGFATEDGVLHAEGIPVPMPDLVRWEVGLRVAPLLRTLKQSRPIAAAIVDGRRARLLRYQAGRIEQLGELFADQDFGDLQDGSGSKRAETTTGVRGTTGKDRANSLKGVATRRMLEEVATRLIDIAGSEGAMVLGGVDAAVAQLRSALPASLEQRTAVRPRLSFGLSDKDVVAEVEAAASELSRWRQAELVNDAFELALSGGPACLGPSDTERAIEERRVRVLLLSDTLPRNDPDGVERLVRPAFEGGATAIEVSGTATQRLDGEAAGVAALLHYRTSD